MGPMPLPRRRVLMVVTSVLLAACGGPDPTASSASAPDSAAPTRSAAASPSASAPGSSETNAPSSSPGPEPIADEPPPLALEPVASGLSAPIGIATGPAGWILVQEQAGRVVAVDLESGDTSLSLDLTDRVLGGGERGLLGLALHPDWPDEPRAFVHYSDLDGNTVLAEFRAADDGTAGAPVLDPASERVLLTAVQPFANHNGGQLAFGPDGRLWLGLGDGGSGGDRLGNGQDPFALLGKILRLDVDAEPTADRAYAIPDDNPFADGAQGAPEAYLIGLRNPWRFSFDRASGELWIADVGQNALEEVNRVDPVASAGANLGWNIMEATSCFAVAGCSSDGLVLPVAQYGRDLGCSVTGGYVYRGTAVDGLAGWYLFSDYCSGLLFGVRSDLEPPRAGEPAPGPHTLLESGVSVSSLGEDADGELYLAGYGSGTVYRIVAGS
jgi:glucose/arabinose dehydrogenase